MKQFINKISNDDLDCLVMDNYVLINNEEYKNYFISPSSMEHYRLLTYLSNSISDSVFIDIGTFKGSSALALSSNKTNVVYSFNLSNELQLTELPNNIQFIVGDIMDEQYRHIILNSKIILLDTFHDGTFEKLFYDYLKHINYNGLLILDDIKLNNEMINFWNSVDYDKDDISNIGHITGTGVVYFD